MPTSAIRTMPHAVKSRRGSVGSWHCTVGGWDSPTPRVTTESFYVLSGGAVTDLDGTQHAFGLSCNSPQRMVWRWDIGEAIHKVWVVVDRSDVDGAGVAAIVAPVEQMFLPASMTDQGVREDAVHDQPTARPIRCTALGRRVSAAGRARQARSRSSNGRRPNAFT